MNTPRQIPRIALKSRTTEKLSIVGIRSSSLALSSLARASNVEGCDLSAATATDFPMFALALHKQGCR